MKRVITYGTYDLFHNGHYRLLERAKQLGDYLIVGVTADGYDESRGKLNVKQSLIERIENVRSSGLADEIIVEEYEGQKINDIQKYDIDIFAIGSDWYGKFDYLNEYAQVVYLERTKGISSTELRNKESGILKLGIAGSGRIAKRFINESKFVSGINVEGVFGRNTHTLTELVNEYELSFYETNYDHFLKKIDAVYIATPHKTHFEYAFKALNEGKHVLCEKPATLSTKEFQILVTIANEKKLIFTEAIKTAYAPGFQRMIAIAKSGLIGKIINVDATFTKLYENFSYREFKKEESGGSITELATYPLIAIVKLLGDTPIDIQSFKYYGNSEVDLFNKTSLIYNDAIATFKVGIGVKSEGDLVISGTKGYLYVPAPWWLTEYFEVRFEDSNKNRKFFYKFDGDGLRYELAEFAKMINDNQYSYKLSHKESLFIISVIESISKNNLTIS